MNKLQKRIVRSVKLSLRGIFALFATYMIMSGRKRKYSTATVAGSVELGVEKISSIAILVSAVCQ